MTSMTIDTGTPSRVELELALRAAALQASPHEHEHGRERARCATRTLMTALASVAGAVGGFDLFLLVVAA